MLSWIYETYLFDTEFYKGLCVPWLNTFVVFFASYWYINTYYPYVMGYFFIFLRDIITFPEMIITR